MVIGTPSTTATSIGRCTGDSITVTSPSGYAITPLCGTLSGTHSRFNIFLLFNKMQETGTKIVSAGPNFLWHTKIYLDIVPIPNFLCETKSWFAFSKFSSVFCLAQNIWIDPKHFVTCIRICKYSKPSSNFSVCGDCKTSTWSNNSNSNFSSPNYQQIMENQNYIFGMWNSF